MCYLVAKDRDAHGCFVLKTTHGKHLVELKRELNKAVGYKGVQLVTISRPTAYGEYAPYHFVDTEQEFQTYPDHQTRKVFNDVLGFRAFCDSYDQILDEDSSQFRIADMSSGKAVDDGYRGIHVYYQKSGKHYPIEIQFNTLFDRQLNNWLHDYLYKKSYPIETGCIMREKYESGLIRNEHECKKVLNNVLSGSERS